MTMFTSSYQIFVVIAIVSLIHARGINGHVIENKNLKLFSTKLETTKPILAYAGCMFDIKADANHLKISTIGFNTYTNKPLDVMLFMKDGRYRDAEYDIDDWVHVVNITVTGQGMGNVTYIPEGSFEPIMIEKWQRAAFYLFSPNGPLLVTSRGSAERTPVDIDNDDMMLFEGIGKRQPIDTGKIFSPRIFNGVIGYTTVNDTPSTKTYASTGAKLIVPTVDNSTYVGKTMFGYQGWFADPADEGVHRKEHWHWGDLTQIGKEYLNVDMWPDTREMGEEEKIKTAYTYPSGETAYVFSSGNRQTVHRHMKWVRDYNTDGVWLQRFISNYDHPDIMRFRDTTTEFVKEGCEKYGRVFAIMYDGITDRVEDIKTDWMHMVDNLKITESDRYLNHDGKPIVALWGYTVRSGATVDQLEEMIDWFSNNSNPKYQASIKLGVNDNWFAREQRWLDSFKQVSVISPWSVGRYDNEAEYQSYVIEQMIPSMNWCESNELLYVPVVWPGFSWHNKKPYTKKNDIPRNGGNFFWTQVSGAIDLGVEALYIAMFDEVDESTAMFKTAENSSMAPAQEYWLNLDADGFSLPSDWYLRCAGQAAQTLKGEIHFNPILGDPIEGIMAMHLLRKESCAIEFIFPDFDEETTIEISLDGGSTYPYDVADNIGSYVLDGINNGDYDVYIRHPGGYAVPMGEINMRGCNELY